MVLNSNLYIIGSAGIPARYGGFETFSENIAPEMTDSFKVHIACSSFVYDPEERSPSFGSVTRFFIPVHPNGIAGLWYDFRAIRYVMRACTAEDILLILGIGPGIFLPLIKPRIRGKIIIHTDGQEWKRKKWNAVVRIFLRACRQLSWRMADKLILDNQALMEDLPSRYRKKAFLLGYGADHLPQEAKAPEDMSGKYALVIARAEPENQLDLILRTFQEMPEATLLVISNTAQTRYGRKMLRKYSSCSNIIFRGTIYNDAELLHSYRKYCTVYIHGHSAGGTNPSLVEAIYCGLRIVAWDNRFNRSTTEEKAFFFSDRESLKKQLTDSFHQTEDQNGDPIEEERKNDFSWKKIASDLKMLIQD